MGARGFLRLRHEWARGRLADWAQIRVAAFALARMLNIRPKSCTVGGLVRVGVLAVTRDAKSLRPRLDSGFLFLAHGRCGSVKAWEVFAHPGNQGFPSQSKKRYSRVSLSHCLTQIRFLVTSALKPAASLGAFGAFTVGAFGFRISDMR